MKEFYLVPRKIMERGMPAHTPAYIPVKSSPIRSNPSIKHLIDLKLKVKDHEYGRSLINYYDESGVVEWDQNGNILAPVTGVHIINDIIHKMTVSKSVFLPDKLPVVKLFFTLSSTPRDLFRNETASKQVFDVASVKRKQNVKMEPPTKKITSWLGY